MSTLALSRLGARAAFSLLALSAGLGGCASDAGVGRVPQGIYGGVRDARHSNIVGIMIQTGRGMAVCTGSLIAPNLVLTARHCVSPISGSPVLCSPYTSGGVTRAASTAGQPYAASSFRVSTDVELSFFGSSTYVTEVLIPEDSTDQPLCGRDIALLRLRTNITAVAPVRPRLDIAPRPQDVFTASGYGATSGTGGGSGQRRMREGLLVEHVGRAASPGGLVYLEDQEWLADTGTCQGDSGGPALDELGEVFGVLSRGAANTCDSPVYTRVDSYSEWIREQARAAATAGGYTLPSWVTPPAPAEHGQGESCQSISQCGGGLECLPTSDSTRECTTDDCTACPETWICNDEGHHCVRDPNLIPPPPPPDAGPPVDAGPAPVEDTGVAPTTPPAPAADSGCSVSTRAPSSRAGGLVGLLVAALSLTLRARRASRR